jgi:hypothetical protein
MADHAFRPIPDARSVSAHGAVARGLLGVDEGLFPCADVRGATQPTHSRRRCDRLRRAHRGRGQPRHSHPPGDKPPCDPGRPGHLRRLVCAPARHRGSVGPQLHRVVPDRSGERADGHHRPDAHGQPHQRDRPAGNGPRGFRVRGGGREGGVHHVPRDRGRAILQRTPQPSLGDHRAAGGRAESDRMRRRRSCRADTSPEREDL